MIAPPLPENEDERLKALKEYSVLDTLPEEEYDDITFLASKICQTPISLISLVDDKRQWFKSHHGLDAASTPKEIAFCSYTINDPDNIFTVNDSREDIRFHDNPLVTGDPHVIFYTGVPLVNPDGFPLGTLCVIDHKPNELNEQQLKSLKALSNQVMKLLELRRTNVRLQSHIYELETKNKALNQFARVAAHDIKSPLNNIKALSEMLSSDYSDNLEGDGKELVDLINTSSHQLIRLIDGILQYSKNANLLSKNRENINVYKVIEEITNLIDSNKEIEFNIEADKRMTLFINKIAFKQILINLLSNSIKYNDKSQPFISICVKEMDDVVKVNVVDNGPGIEEKDRERIFDIFETTANKDHNGYHGTGIGLATVRSLVEGLGGNIKEVSHNGEGANFQFTLKK